MADMCRIFRNNPYFEYYHTSFGISSICIHESRCRSRKKRPHPGIGCGRFLFIALVVGKMQLQLKSDQVASF